MIRCIDGGDLRASPCRHKVAFLVSLAVNKFRREKGGKGGLSWGELCLDSGTFISVYCRGVGSWLHDEMASPARPLAS